MDQVISRGPFVMKSERDSVQEVRELADFLDTKYRLPFGWRIGWDGIIGLIPGIGDFVTSLMSFYIVYRAAILGCPLSVVLRMGLNILVDNLIDVLPVVGNFLDFAWKSNTKNLALLESYLLQPHRTTVSSRIVVFSVLVFLLLMIVGIGVLTFYLARWLFGTFQNAW